MRGVILVLAVFLFPLGALAEPELVVERALWAFTGKPIPGAFNILTVEVRNVSDEPYQGSIPLAKASVGVPEMQQIGIAPGGKRSVQFTPYVDENGGGVYSWRLSWDKGLSDLSDFNQDISGGFPETVALIEDTDTFAKGGEHFPTFPDRYFPTNVSVTDGLAAVVLSYVPKWEEARAKAF
ncbi:MAG: hypothetical protein ACI8T1_000231 [Verrucomicrobiales bacterium]|jgi:hypothetical protein